METKKKQFKMPHTFVIIGIIILFAVLLTWIIPAGSYTRFENEAGIKVIDPNDFNYIDKTPVNPLEIPLYIVKAFIKRIDLMLVIMFAGGAFHILTKTGALHAVVAKMAKIFSTRVYLFLPILTLVFGLICTTQGVNLFIAFAPIMVMMAFAMGLDSITGASIILLGGAIGFSTGPLNINTTIVAQKIAGLPLYSGVGYRFICFAVFYVITNIYLIRYALKIQKHPELSPMYEIDKTSEFRNAADLDSFGKLDARKILIMLVFFASLILIVYGGIKLDWDMSETASVFLALAVIEGVLGGFGPSAISKEFLEGCKKMLGAAFIIGMAQAISSIMNAGHITDTVVHALANGLNFVPTILLGPAMLLANTIINVFLTSGSGQAAAVIPILAPLADLVGVTRQTAILSFNFGDGFCNYVLPTSTALMGIISAVNIPYDRWMKFMWKLFLIWLAVGSVLCKKMLGAAFIIGMAQAISSIMNAGHITDTVVHALANGLNFVPTILLGPAMLLANTIINVFLTSGSGQAAAVIPILAPLADLVGVTRQTAILSFNFGDGFCNYVLPTSTALMGIISAVNIPYDRWMKFMWKLFLIWLAVGSVLLMIAQAINLGPM